MGETAKLTRFEVKDLVFSWFKKITDHAPVEEMLSMLDREQIEMKFPEATLKSREEFRNWYHTVTNKFFDQVHEVKMLDVEIAGIEAQVRLVVNWQARTWDAPNAYSTWQGVYAHQSWVVKRDVSTGKPVISSYAVENFDPMDGPLKIQ